MGYFDLMEVHINCKKTILEMEIPRQTRSVKNFKRKREYGWTSEGWHRIEFDGGSLWTFRRQTLKTKFESHVGNRLITCHSAL